MTLRFEHIAMATRFELWMVGEDAGFLQSIAFEAWEEVDRLEMMLSRFDSRAEVARINREATERPVRIEVELFDILQDCQKWLAYTLGYFDICICSDESVERSDRWMLNLKERTVRLSSEQVYLDLGGYGKGYAIDAIGNIIKEYSVNHALVHGGTSSALAWGTQESGAPWQIEVPVPETAKTLAPRKPLIDQGFSYSGSTYTTSPHPAQAISDILNPHTNKSQEEAGACWVVAPSALKAEVLTTAMVAMGQARAHNYFQSIKDEELSGEWI